MHTRTSESLRGFILSMLLFMAALLASTHQAKAWFWEDDHPTEEMITAWANAQLPAHLTIVEIDIQSQDMRQGLQEYSESRVTLRVEAQEDLFRANGAMEDQTTILTNTYTQGQSEPLVLYALAQAVPTGQGWDGEIVFDKSSVQVLRGSAPRSVFPSNSVVEGSPEQAQRAAEIAQKAQLAQEERERAAAAAEAERLAELERRETARLERAALAAGSFAGIAVCKNETIEIDKIDLDPATGTGTLVHRSVAHDVDRWITTPLSITERDDSGTYALNGPPFDDRIHFQSGTNTTRMEGRCIYTLHAHDAPPPSLDAQRAAEQAWLRSLGVGETPARLFTKTEERGVLVAITEVRARGFQMEITHPEIVSNRMNNSDSNTDVSTVDIRFVDAPGPALVTGRVEGRGTPLFGGRCTVSIASTRDGGLSVANVDDWGCNTKLVLAPGTSGGGETGAPPTQGPNP
jgi:hypothetical protein